MTSLTCLTLILRGLRYEQEEAAQTVSTPDQKEEIRHCPVRVQLFGQTPPLIKRYDVSGNRGISHAKPETVLHAHAVGVSLGEQSAEVGKMRTIEKTLTAPEYRQLMQDVRRLERATGRKVNIEARAVDEYHYRVVYRTPGDSRRIYYKQSPLF